MFEKKGEKRRGRQEGRSEGGRVGVLVDWIATCYWNVLPGVSMYSLSLFLNREFSEWSVFNRNFAKNQNSHRTPAFYGRMVTLAEFQYPLTSF